MRPTIAIVADFNSSRSHLATQEAIAHSAASLGVRADYRWVSTTTLSHPPALKGLAESRAVWIGPGSPYASMEGALAAIRLAREQGIPLLGTCGGFQHIILEYSRNVLGYKDAEHEETAPGASTLFISRLACSLVGRTMTITLAAGSKLAGIYGQPAVQEEYLCNFGVNPDRVDVLRSGSLKAVASDPEGAIRAVELPGHPFFIGTLFLPQHRSTAGNPHPLITAFLKAAS